MPLIELTEVSKIYGFGDATTIALDEVSLTINRGEFIAVMGPSGSGKSTLMNIIGLLDRPTHGSYKLNNRSVARLRPNQRARARRDSIGFVFQTYNLLPRLNVIENVALPLSYKGVPPVRRSKLAATLLERVGLSDRQYYFPRHLSGGQAQRAVIARALINKPKLIIADEPTGNLDSASSRVVMELLSEIHKEGNTIIMVTHNPELTRWASRVVYMHDGDIVHDEKTRLGEVAETAKRTLVFVPRITEEDELAGVSAMMKAIETRDDKKSRSKRPLKTVKKRLSRKPKALPRRKARK